MSSCFLKLSFTPLYIFVSSWYVTWASCILNFCWTWNFYLQALQRLLVSNTYSSTRIVRSHWTLLSYPFFYHFCATDSQPLTHSSIALVRCGWIPLDPAEMSWLVRLTEVPSVCRALKRKLVHSEQLLQGVRHATCCVFLLYTYFRSCE